MQIHAVTVTVHPSSHTPPPSAQGNELSVSGFLMESGGASAPAARSQVASHQIIDCRTHGNAGSLKHTDYVRRQVKGSVVGIQCEGSRVVLAVCTHRHVFHNVSRTSGLADPARGVGRVVAHPGKVVELVVAPAHLFPHAQAEISILRR